MTEPDDRETRQALRAMLSDRIGALTPPAGVYETVRRRHRRRQRALVGGALVLAVAAVAVPSIALADRPAGTPPAAVPCPDSDSQPVAPVEEARLPTQRNSPGSLGGDAELVAAVLRVGWSAMGPRDGLDPTKVRVRMLERVEGQLVVVVTATGNGLRRYDLVLLVGPDPDHLRITSGGGFASPTPLHRPYPDGDAWVQAIEVCGHRYAVVTALPGTTGRASWITRITPQLRAERTAVPVPLRADGVTAFRLDAPDVRMRLERAGRVVSDGLLAGVQGSPWMLPTDDDLQRVAAEAPGDGDPAVVRSIVDMTLGASALPEQQSDWQVLWSGRAARGRTAAVVTCLLPGGVRYASIATSRGVNSLEGNYRGLLAPGALERTVLATGANRPGDPLVVFAVGGRWAEAVLANGDVARFALSGGGGALASGGTVRRVRVYGAGDRLIGEQVPGQGLVDVPRETPL